MSKTNYIDQKVIIRAAEAGVFFGGDIIALLAQVYNLQL